MSKLRAAMLQGASKGSLTVSGAHEIISKARRNIASYANEHGVPLHDGVPVRDESDTSGITRDLISNGEVKIMVKDRAEAAMISGGKLDTILAGYDRGGSPMMIDMRSSDS